MIRLNRRHIDALSDVDFEAGHELERANGVSRSEMRKDIVHRFNACQEIWFGYKIGSGLAGYVTLKPFFPGYKHCEVYWLSVQKKYQGQGIGTHLLRHVEKYAKQKGFRKAFIYTGKTMSRTRRFYEKRGYSFVNEFPGYYGFTAGNTTAVLYGKEI